MIQEGDRGIDPQEVIDCGVQYIQPDKPAQMFINEVGVDPTHHRMGLGGRLLEALLETARQLHCTEAWVAVDLDNEPARTLYTAAGGKEESPACSVFAFHFDR